MSLLLRRNQSTDDEWKSIDWFQNEGLIFYFESLISKTSKHSEANYAIDFYLIHQSWISVILRWNLGLHTVDIKANINDYFNSSINFLQIS